MSKKAKDGILYALEVAAEVIAVLLIVIPFFRNDTTKRK